MYKIKYVHTSSNKSILYNTTVNTRITHTSNQRDQSLPEANMDINKLTKEELIAQPFPNVRSIIPSIAKIKFQIKFASLKLKRCSW